LLRQAYAEKSYGIDNEQLLLILFFCLCQSLFLLLVEVILLRVSSDVLEPERPVPETSGTVCI